MADPKPSNAKFFAKNLYYVGQLRDSDFEPSDYVGPEVSEAQWAQWKKAEKSPHSKAGKQALKAEQAFDAKVRGIFDTLKKESHLHRHHWEVRVKALLHGILDTETGKALAREIGKIKHKLLIVPYIDTNRNALTERFPGENGSGGTDVLIKFDPDAWFGGDKEAAADPDDVLVHELTHALRRLSGTDAKTYDIKVEKKHKVRYHFDDLEEFIAVLVSNIYVSEKSSDRPLRKDHHGHHSLSARERNPANFAHDFKRHIKDFIDGMKFFAEDLKTVNCDFNPVAAYLGYKTNFWERMLSK